MPSRSTAASTPTRAVLALAVGLTCAAPCAAQARRTGSTGSTGSTAADEAFAAAVARFDRRADSLRQALHIPGMSAAIVRDQALAWSKGYGLSDVEHGTAATPDTPYEIASIIKPMSATLLLRLIEQGRVSLDDPMAKYSAGYKTDSVTVRHVLTHTSQGVPGTAFQYNGNIYASLFDVIVKTTGERFRKTLVTDLLTPIGAANSIPGNDVADNVSAMNPLLGEANVAQYVEALGRLARSYKLLGDTVERTQNRLRGLSTANGLISSVTDLAKFDIAIDRHAFLRPETQRLAWTRARANDGKELPYGLGWFVQTYEGQRLVWHNGYLPEVASALYLKIPDAGLTLILLANSDALSAPFRLAAGDVTASAFACAFLREFAVASSNPECATRSTALATRWLDSARAATPRIVRSALEDSLWAIEKASWTAWQKRDVAFFDNFLSADHVDVHPNGVLNKARVLAGVAAPCNVQSYTGDSFRFVQFDANTALLTYRAEQNTVCGGTQIPSPMWVGSLYARRDGRWVNVMFQESPLPRRSP